MQSKGAVMWNGLLLLLGLVAAAAATSSKNELRVNYGATFTFAGYMDPAAQRWLHTYVISIPEFNIPSLDVATCSAKTVHCQSYMELLEIIRGHHQRIRAENRLLHDDIKNFFPDLSYAFGRSDLVPRGGLVPAFGKAFKYLFGSATDADYDVLRRNLQEVGTLINTLSHSAQVQASTLNSYSTLLTIDISNIQSQLDSMNRFLGSVTEGTATMVKSMETMSREISLAMAASNANCSEIITNLQTYRRGLLALARGELSPDLLSPKEMASMVKDVQAALEEHHPRYRLPVTHTQYFYNLKTINVFRHGSNIYITVNFPVTDSRSAAKLYRVHAFPLLYDHNVSHATILEDLPAYFAKTEDGSGYMELSESLMRSCKEMDGIFMCAKLVPKIDASEMSCTSALFEDNTTAVHEKCHNSLLVNGLEPSFLELEPGTVLVTKVEKPVLQCQKKSKVLPNCTQCVVKLPCECSLVTNDGPYMPENMQTCRIRVKTHQVLMPTNMHLLMHFMNSPNMTSGLTGKSLLENPLFSMPVFPKFSDALPDHFKELRDKFTRLPLLPVMEKVKKGEEVMTNPFQAKAAQTHSNEFMHFFVMASLAAIFLAFVGLVLMIFLVRNLRTRMLIMRD